MLRGQSFTAISFVKLHVQEMTVVHSMHMYKQVQYAHAYTIHYMHMSVVPVCICTYVTCRVVQYVCGK